MNNLDLFVKVITGLKEIDNVKKYLKEIKKSTKPRCSSRWKQDRGYELY